MGVLFIYFLKLLRNTAGRFYIVVTSSLFCFFLTGTRFKVGSVP